MDDHQGDRQSDGPEDGHEDGFDRIAMIMGPLDPDRNLMERLTAVMDARGLSAHDGISAVDQHWQIAIHLWPALKSITRATGRLTGHLLATGVDADMLAGRGPHPHYPRDPQRHLTFHTPIPPADRWLHQDLPLHEPGTHADPGRYDLVLVNLPYHDVALFDPGRRGRLGTYHRDLLAGALARTVPGGFTVALVNPVFLDDPDPDLRQAVAEKADLVGAVRLPGGTMRPDSNAQGPTDVLFLYHRRPGESGSGIPASRDVISDSSRGHLNEYWLDNPHHVLGVLGAAQKSGFTVGPGFEPLGRLLQVAFDQIATVAINGLADGASTPRSAPRPGPGRSPGRPADPADGPDL
ncbi:hypothetical protein ACFT2C_04785 [Promicromonospora sp. NPDC057138]|uniref:hypothetical protein n=1 Tax=Promicromonospora sp. NPDC057138 TaxID=3346031 RepID=UPI0036305207